MGSIIPDVEVPILYLTGLEMRTGHGALHTLIGALTGDVLLAIMAVYLVYPALAGLWEGRFGARWIHYAGVDVGIIERPTAVAYGVLVGIAFHLTLDYLTHVTMPYLWPFAGPVDTLPVGRELWWLVLVNALLLILLARLLMKYLGKIGRFQIDRSHRTR